MTTKILFIVSPQFGHIFSGHYQYVLSILDRWKNPDITFDLWGSNYDWKSYLYQKHKQQGPEQKILWKNTGNFGKFRRLIWTFRLIYFLVFNRYNYDVIHFHVLNWGTLLSPLLTKMLRKKVVYTITRDGFDNPSSVKNNRLGMIKLYLYKKFDGIIGLSPALINDCQRLGFSSHLLVLPNYMMIEKLENGRDQERRLIMRKIYGIDHNEKTILFVGSMIERKGVDIAIDVFIRLAENHHDIWLLLVGPKDSNDSPKIDDHYINEQNIKLSTAGLEDRVIWLGLVREPDELADYYYMSDVFFLPTRSEGQGYVFSEAMASELPIVTTLLKGITDISVTTGKNGYLITLDDVEGFINVLDYLLSTESSRKMMGIHSREHMEKNFSFNQHCKRLTQFYSNI